MPIGATPAFRSMGVVGKFCALARGVRFMMYGANHQISGFSTYAFSIFGNGWESVTPQPGDFPDKGDDGAIVVARAVVVSDVPADSLVGGNLAKAVKRRFPEEVVNSLLAINCWDWSVDKISRNLPAIVGADLGVLRGAT